MNLPAVQKLNIPQEHKHTVRNVGIGVVVVLGSAFVINKIVKAIKRRNALNNAATNPNVRYAMMLRSAMNPSGTTWLMWSDGTTEEVMYKTASQITDFNEVARQYKNLYNSELLADIQSELNTTEFAKFMNIINNNKNVHLNSSAQSFMPDVVKKLPITVRDTYIYKNLTDYHKPFGYIKSVPKNSIIRAACTGNIYKTFGKTTLTTINAVEFVVLTEQKKSHFIYINLNDIMLTTLDEWKQKYKHQFNNPVVLNEADF